MDLTSLTACELSRAYDAGKTNPLEVLEAYADRLVAQGDLCGKIFAHLSPARAKAEAQAAAARMGARLGPLDGVPLSWKDNFDSAGIGTEAGTALLAGRVPVQDADALACVTQAGGVCLGKTHMSELAFSGLGLNPVTATPPNRHDPGLVPGGSSSGAAASVAFGLAPAALGTDTGGSVRIPAAWNDLVGFKTSEGALSLQGVVKLCPSFDTIGPLARSVEDCAAILAELGIGPVVSEDALPLSQCRIAVLRTAAFDDIERPQQAAFDHAMYRLEAAGAQITDLEAPCVTEALSLSAALFTPEAYAECGPLIETAPDKMFPAILERFRAGRDVMAVDYLQARARMTQLRSVYAAATAEYDAVLLPTAPISPPRVDRLLSEEDYYVRANLLTLRNTRIANLMGLCAVTLPSGMAHCGVMAMKPQAKDAALLALSFALEAALNR